MKSVPPEPEELISVFLGKDVIIYTGDRIVKGKFEKFTQCEILLTVDKMPLVVMKSAIDAIKLDELPQV